MQSEGTIFSLILINGEQLSPVFLQSSLYLWITIGRKVICAFDSPTLSVPDQYLLRIR